MGKNKNSLIKEIMKKKILKYSFLLTTIFFISCLSPIGVKKEAKPKIKKKYQKKIYPVKTKPKLKKEKPKQEAKFEIFDKKNGYLLIVPLSKDYDPRNITYFFSEDNCININLYQIIFENKEACQKVLAGSSFVKRFFIEVFKQSSQISISFREKVHDCNITKNKNKIFISIFKG